MKKQQKVSKMVLMLLAFVSTVSLDVFAQIPAGKITCRVAVIHSDLVDGYAEAKFLADVVAKSSHGGDSNVFIFQNHRVEVLADGKWLGVSWWRNERLIAETVTVASTLVDQSRVLIAYNPENQEQQVALDCSTIH